MRYYVFHKDNRINKFMNAADLTNNGTKDFICAISTFESKYHIKKLAKNLFNANDDGIGTVAILSAEKRKFIIRDRLMGISDGHTEALWGDDKDMCLYALSSFVLKFDANNAITVIN